MVTDGHLDSGEPLGGAEALTDCRPLPALDGLEPPLAGGGAGQPEAEAGYCRQRSPRATRTDPNATLTASCGKDPGNRRDTGHGTTLALRLQGAEILEEGAPDGQGSAQDLLSQLSSETPIPTIVCHQKLLELVKILSSFVNMKKLK